MRRDLGPVMVYQWSKQRLITAETLKLSNITCNYLQAKATTDRIAAEIIKVEVSNEGQRAADTCKC